MNKWIFILLILVAILIFGYFENKSLRKKLKGLSEGRPVLNREDYIVGLTEKGYERKMVEVVYDVIDEWTHFKDFSLYPEDSIVEVYEVDDEDLVDMISQIHKMLNIPEPKQQDIDSVHELNSIVNAEFLLTLCELMAMRELTIKMLKTSS